MSITFVQQKVEQSTTSVSSFTTSAMTVTAGNALTVCSSGNSHSELLTITDSRSNPYVPQINQNTVPSLQVNWDLARNIVGGSTTFTVTPQTAQYVSVGVLEWAGLADDQAETTSMGFNESSQIPTPGPMTPPSPGDLYLSAWTHAGAGNETFTAAPSWTLRANLTLTANQPLGSESLIESGLQEGYATLSGSAGPKWVAAAMALRSADVAAPNDADSPNFIPMDFPMTDRGFADEG